MKNLIAFLVLLFLIVSCNDGNVAVQDISFDNVTGSNCVNLSYKIKGNEVLIIKFDDISKAYLLDQTPIDKPIILNIDAKNPVTYRVYNGVPTAANFCGNQLPPAEPIVVEEWTATSGTIEITTTVSKSTNTTTNATTINGYNNFVQLKNITFKKPNGDQFYETFNFGNINVAITPLNLSFDQPIEKCASSQIFTSKIGVVALMSIENSGINLIDKVVTPINNPRTIVLNSTNNKLFYRVFENLDVLNYKCKTTFLGTDDMTQEWIASTGSIEVETTESGGQYTHKFFLKGVNLIKQNSDFYLGDNFYLGQIKN
jgi:hypothetical protein